MHAAPFLPPGELSIGCNYWASHAGTRMWREWDPSIVDADLGLLADRELRLVRVFPLWPDFQPIAAIRGGAGQIRGYASRWCDEAAERLLPPDSDGLDPVMLRRLTDFANAATRHHLRLIVALVTGWMSGRLFVPSALENLNPITDATALQWEVRLVRGLVRHLREHAAVVAWDLGNECNVMGSATASQSWLWTATVADAVRSVDPTRPVVSGMHGLATEPGSAWSIAAQAENTDILTTHPYPLFTPHCAREPLHTLRPVLHAAAETRLYADLGRRPAFVEETGSLGPTVSGEEETAAHARALSFSLWAYDCRALLWWCAFDFSHLDHAPYEWEPVERELGLFRRGGEAKPIVAALQQVGKALARTGIRALPPRSVEAACVLPLRGESWGTAFGVFILALQAGFDVRFVADGSPLPDVPLYILPSVRSSAPLTRSTWRAILDRIERGASLYASLDDGILTEMEDVFGVRVMGRYQRPSGGETRLMEGEREVCFPGGGGTAFSLASSRATVLATEAQGHPVFTRAGHGKGEAYLLAFALESRAAELPGAFDRDDPWALRRLYGAVSSRARDRRALRVSSPFVGVTEHPESENSLIAVMVNYGSTTCSESVRLRPGWNVRDVLSGDAAPGATGEIEVRIPGSDAAILRITR